MPRYFRSRSVKTGFLIALSITCLSFSFTSNSLHAKLSTTESLTVDVKTIATPFPHFWEQMFGSGRAILSLRDSYRRDLRSVKKITDFHYVRFHAILHDEVGVYDEDDHGVPVYNFTYVDSIYDGLLADGVRPVVEIGFMPKKLAFNPDALHPFWYKPNVSPPKSMERWDGLIQHFAQHLVDRYGIAEVAHWYFEVWNEPNIDFWNGIPRMDSYFELYDHTARALKAVNPRLRVGGPATAAAQWIPQFLEHAAARHVPVDFVSTHGYAEDTVKDLLGTQEAVAMDDRVCRAVAKVRGDIDVSRKPRLPLFWTEWNVQGMKEARDTTFVGAALANTIRECDGHVDMMSFWTFSDVFEEGGPSTGPFHGNFGLRAVGGINKPSFYAFLLLHKLGDRRIANPSSNVIATRDKDGSLAIVVWNLVDPETRGVPHEMELKLSGVYPSSPITIERVDQLHGNVLSRWVSMGKPENPTPAQAGQLNSLTELPSPERSHLHNGSVHLRIEPNDLVLIKVKR